MSGFADLWRLRGFVSTAIKRDFDARYRNSLLGAIWAVASPIAMVSVYILVFSKIMPMRAPASEQEANYGVYLCSGLFAWTLFSETILRGQNSFFENSNLIKKINFPNIIFPIIATLNSLVSFGIVLAIFFAYLGASGNWPSMDALALIPAVAIQTAMAFSLAVILGILNVYFRDTAHLSSIGLQFWFWLTPIVYHPRILGDIAEPLIRYNPMSSLTSFYQAVLAYKKTPDWMQLGYPLLSAFILSFIAFSLYRKCSHELADEL